MEESREDTVGAAIPLMLGDEAAAAAALDAGVATAYGFPGTPSTEALEALMAGGAGAVVQLAANEKAALEQALGTSLAGRRSLVVMKHVGLNVAMDPFVSGALAALRAGLVLLVADDPGMHSSQNEQDTRLLARFARVPCLEPATVQEVYDRTREAFELSERHRVLVVVRLVTRVAHARAPVRRAPPAPPPAPPPHRVTEWSLIPAYARGRWAERLAGWAALAQESEAATPPPRGSGRLGVVTAGIGGAYWREIAPELEAPAVHLHLDRLPLPRGRLAQLAGQVAEILVIEEGAPLVEEALSGVLPGPVSVRGRLSGDLPPAGELTPDALRRALGLPVADGVEAGLALPPRPPQLCQGCAHRDAFAALALALGDTRAVVTGDIGCYALGVLPPHSALDSVICMGASVGMAKGASDAGQRPAIAVIGDGTFLHSGIQPLMDAVAADTDMTVVILDNETIAMTGQQAPVLPGSRLVPLILAMGADPGHVHRVEAHPRRVEELAEVLAREIAHPGTSVVITRRECVVAARKRRRRER